MTTPLMLQDRAYTRMLIVALPRQHPCRKQLNCKTIFAAPESSRTAGSEVNATLSGSGTNDPVLL